MRQYTTQYETETLRTDGVVDQNYKLPFEPANDEIGRAYSIGELINLLPRRIKDSGFTYQPQINRFGDVWCVAYTDDTLELVACYDEELIRALYDMTVNLKREGRI